MISVTWEFKHSEAVILICDAYLKVFFLLLLLLLLLNTKGHYLIIFK